VSAYTKAIELDKDDFRSYERRGRVYFELGDYDQAIINLTKAIAIKPSRYLLYDLRGRAHSMLGDKDAVTADFIKAIELRPGHNVYLHKALAFCELGEYAQAIADLSWAIELKADYAYAYLKRGVIYQRLGEKENAKVDYQRTIELDTNRSWSEQAREYLQALMENE
jgi:tetratricopeptide (TPR) repeat protein